TGYPPATGGAQLHAHYLNQHLTKRGHQVSVHAHWNEIRFDWLRGTTLDSPPPSSYEIDGIPVNILSLSNQQREAVKSSVRFYYLNQNNAIKNISSKLLLHLRAGKSDPDIIHNIRMGREPISFASLQLARENKLPFVFTPLHHPRWSTPLHRHFHDLYRKADAVFALTNWEKDELIRLGVSANNIHIIGHGPVLDKDANADQFRKQYNLHGSIVLFLAQKFKYKGFKSLLQAASLVWKEKPDTHFVFMGPRTKYSNKIFANIKHDHIHEIGRVDLAEKSSALLAADILCVPSTQESFGGVFLEGWLTGCAVIGGTAPAVSEVIADGEDGYTVAQDPIIIADRIITLLHEPDRRNSMVENGRKKVEQLYTWDKIAERVEIVYKSL
ncbi:MAG: glycosyltransferase family 4 protein, partial [Chloroflexota bacterium]